MTQLHGADIAGAGKRLTFIEMKKEIDRVPLEEREDDQWIYIRPAYMAKCTNQDPTTISRHLKEFKALGWIDTAVKRIKDSDTGEWTSETFVRTLVDLSDLAVISMPAKPRGKPACQRCGSVKINREVRIICEDCEHIEVHGPVAVNPEEADLQSAIQAEQPADDTAEPLNCSLLCGELTTVGSSELQFAFQGIGPVPAIHEDTIDLTAAIQCADRLPLDLGDLQRNAYKTALSWLTRREPGKAEALIDRIENPTAQAIVLHLAAGIVNLSRFWAVVLHEVGNNTILCTGVMAIGGTKALYSVGKWAKSGEHFCADSLS